jgi:monoamine oxidase
MNPALAYTTIHFKPELPPEKQQFNILDGDSNVFPGHVIKIYLSYKFPFWHDDHIDTVNGSSDTNNLRLDEIYPAKNIFNCQIVKMIILQ